MGEQVVVTDGSDSFYGSRTVFQSLFDHGDFEKITALSTSVAEAKKMLISRQARYSGLIDVLDFSEGTLAEGMAGASTWVAVNAKAASVPEMATAAKDAGVSRAFIHVCSGDADAEVAALEAALGSSGLTYTLMRTGTLTDKGTGGAIKLSEVDTPVCEDVPKEDIFRFITEALTIEDAYGRSFSLCPSTDDSQLKEMRFAGCSRREEVVALLKGQISEQAKEAATEEAAPTEEDAKSKVEEEADREEELKMLLQRAKERGIENQKRMQEEEKAKKALREERAMYFKSMETDDDDDKKDGGGEEPPPPPPAEDKKKDDDDGLALA